MLGAKRVGEAAMPDIRARVMECSEDEEHVLGLLGKAVVAQWDHLPPPVRDQLVQQAELIRDPDEVPHLHQRIMAVILKFQGHPS
jgi:hypothetical protein